MKKLQGHVTLHLTTPKLHKIKVSFYFKTVVLKIYKLPSKPEIVIVVIGNGRMNVGLRLKKKYKMHILLL